MTKETKAGLAANLNTAMAQTLDNLQWLEVRKSPEAMLSKQTAIQTIVLVVIAQVLLETTEESNIILSH
jgi:hypothetical protein